MASHARRWSQETRLESPLQKPQARRRRHQSFSHHGELILETYTQSYQANLQAYIYTLITTYQPTPHATSSPRAQTHTLHVLHPHAPPSALRPSQPNIQPTSRNPHKAEGAHNQRSSKIPPSSSSSTPAKCMYPGTADALRRGEGGSNQHHVVITARGMFGL